MTPTASTPTAMIKLVSPKEHLRANLSPNQNEIAAIKKDSSPRVDTGRFPKPVTA